MKAYRHRLIFWPVLPGAVVFLLSGKETYGILLPSVIDGAVAALFVLAAIYSSDRSRRGSGVLRRDPLAKDAVAFLVNVKR
ncbi:MAG: hypothetical protein WCC27_01000 [Acidobacteriaceae bacterium]